VKIPENVIQEIIEKTDICEIVGNYTTLTRKGNRYWGLCPFHSEKTPSFTVTPATGLFYCFGCGKGGTVFTFLMETEKLSFVEAVETLGRRAGVEVSREDGVSGESLRAQNALKELFRRVTGSFHFLFTRSEKGRAAYAYLTGRGIQGEVINTFQIGYAPPDPYWLESFLKKHGYSDDFLVSSGLLRPETYGKKRAFFTHRIIFPIFSSHGDVIAFGGRILEGNGPKYLNSAESALFRKGSNLYGFFQGKDAIRKESRAVIVEGYMDVIALHQAGVRNAVAPLGTAFTPDQARLLRRFADTVILFFDGDAAGQKATQRCAEICEALEFTIYAAALPEDKDPADYVQEGRIEELQKILKYPIPIMEYLLKKHLERGDPAVSGNEESILQDIFPYIGSIVSAVHRDMALSKLSELFGIEKSALAIDFQRRGTAAPKKKELEEKKKEVNLSMTPELLLIIASIDNKEVFSHVRSRLSLDSNFTETESRDVFISLEESYRTGNWNSAALLEKIENEALKEFIIKKLSSDEFAVNRDKMVQDAIKRIKIRNLEDKQKRVERNLRRLNFDTKDNEAQITELLGEKMYLDGELKKLKDSRE
jgi:DNA primase